MGTGKVQHFEIPAEDVGRARTFYGEVFGWSFEDIEGYEDVEFIQPGGEEGEVGVIGGDIYKRSTPEPPTVVITVDRIEPALVAVEQHGGRRLGDVESMPGMGRYAYFEDTEGNRLGLWEEAADSAEVSPGQAETG
ncbi:VOC family protein [Georgenia sp. AZ-5]|uniref:VOC family protein n=1 Tax=Georgenia sp. AZ-5 TaxID=3367526 RepID=UPI003754FD39